MIRIHETETMDELKEMFGSTRELPPLQFVTDSYRDYEFHYHMFDKAIAKIFRVHVSLIQQAEYICREDDNTHRYNKTYVYSILSGLINQSIDKEIQAQKDLFEYAVFKFIRMIAETSTNSYHKLSHYIEQEKTKETNDIDQDTNEETTEEIHE